MAPCPPDLMKISSKSESAEDGGNHWRTAFAGQTLGDRDLPCPSGTLCRARAFSAYVSSPASYQAPILFDPGSHALKTSGARLPSMTWDYIRRAFDTARSSEVPSASLLTRRVIIVRYFSKTMK